MATAVVETEKHQVLEPAVEPEKRQALQPRQRFVLDGIDWPTYRTISEALTGHHVRLTYDRGLLELMTKSTLHGMLSQLYYYFLHVLAEEFNLPFASCGDMTCDREDLDRGAEPDQGVYIVNAPLIRGKEQIDLAVDPPPDLMLEIDLSRSSQRRLVIYAALKVPEVWQADTDTLRVLHLDANGQYASAAESLYFPGIPVAEIVGFVQRRAEVDEIQLGREFRAWVREHIARNGKESK